MKKQILILAVLVLSGVAAVAQQRPITAVLTTEVTIVGLFATAFLRRAV